MGLLEAGAFRLQAVDGILLDTAAPQLALVFCVAAALGLGVALEQTGAASAIAGSLLDIVKSNPYLALAMVYVVTTFFTEVITNNAAAAFMFPIALATAQQLGVSFMPFAITLMISASCAFITPTGYQTNLGTIGALLGRNDTVFLDKLVYESWADSIRF